MKKINELKKLLEKNQVIGLVTHIRPDGDAWGSVLGMAEVISQLGKKPIIFSDAPLPDYLDFLKEKITFHVTDSFEDIDFLFCFDLNQPSRASLPQIIEEAKKRNIGVGLLDHHLPLDNSFFDFVWQEPKKSSVSEMIYEFVTAIDLKPNTMLATFLYLGIMTDTGSLSFTNASTETYGIVSELLKLGAQAKKINQNLTKRSIAEKQFIGRVISRLKLNKKYSIAFTYITQEDFKEFNLDRSAGSDMASYIEQTKEGKIVVVATQEGNGKIKVSMRANKSTANVAKIAEFFGGGGHKKAAGFDFEGSLEEVIPKVTKKLDTQI